MPNGAPPGHYRIWPAAANKRGGGIRVRPGEGRGRFSGSVIKSSFCARYSPCPCAILGPVTNQSSVPPSERTFPLILISRNRSDESIGKQRPDVYEARSSAWSRPSSCRRPPNCGNRAGFPPAAICPHLPAAHGRRCKSGCRRCKSGSWFSGASCCPDWRQRQIVLAEYHVIIASDQRSNGRDSDDEEDLPIMTTNTSRPVLF